MKFISTKIPDVFIIEPKIFGDERGFFTETFRADLFENVTGSRPFVQDNHSRSVRGILRGLHYQIGRPQGKLVRVVRGAVFDVAVDLRSSSDTFGQWVGVELSEDNKRQLWVPEGFAHGFYTLTEFADFVYKCTDYYLPAQERCLLWNDPDINIDWPIQLNSSPKLSEKDNAGVLLSSAELF